MASRDCAADADDLGTNELMRRTGRRNTCLWRWQSGSCIRVSGGLSRDKTRPSRVPPLVPAIGAPVVALTQTDPPGETTHGTVAAAMAALVRIRVSSVQRIWRSYGLQPHRLLQFNRKRPVMGFKSSLVVRQAADRSFDTVELAVALGRLLGNGRAVSGAHIAELTPIKTSPPLNAGTNR